MHDQSTRQFSISDSPTPEEIKEIQDRVENHKRVKTEGEIDRPGIDISLLLKDSLGKVQGGIIASTVFRVMHLEVLWVSEEFRRCGYGSQLVLNAEVVGYEEGCLSSQTWTFAFQGPGFYPTLGYEQLGTYDGYPDDLTEHVFLKHLASNHELDSRMVRILEEPDSRGLYLTDLVSEADTKILHEGLHSHVKVHVGDKDRGIKIALVIKDKVGELIGGLYAWTTLDNMIFEYLWIDEGYRDIGLGSKLIQGAEKAALNHGCIASQAYCFSFQALGFFKKMGYEILGVSDGYPPPVKEYYLIKKYDR